MHATSIMRQQFNHRASTEPGVELLVAFVVGAAVVVVAIVSTGVGVQV